MIKFILSLTFFICSLTSYLYSQDRQKILLNKEWKFSKGDIPNAQNIDFSDSKWQKVTIPHDWAIYGPFDKNNDAQKVAIEQNMEKKATVKTGRTGGLPYVGIGWYRRIFDVPNFTKDQNIDILFDGAMSEAKIFINGSEVLFWPYGYNSFHCNITDYLNKDGKNNVLAVRLENSEQSSRWYPGAGLYRNVHLIVTPEVHVPIWGTQLTTPSVSKELAAINLKTKLENVTKGSLIRLETSIFDNEGNLITTKDNTRKMSMG
jgi:beta-galactosidase